ncbi:MAG: hydroxyacylglutathione hydrolase [Kiritimatiellae bacterium]|nr:hydroxyacylglutathione hydrolase [Kiritimatiellia bacterium]
MRKASATRKFGDVEVTVLPIGDNYTYFVSWQRWAAVVDPAAAEPVLRLLKKRSLELITVLVTHPHNDHVAGNAELTRLTNCTVVGPSRGRVPHQERNVREGDSLRLDSAVVTVMSTPGHGRLNVCYYMEPKNKRPGLLWTGDTLFVGGCGRLMGCPPAPMWDSLHRLAALPEETLVYCGHDYALENYEFAAKLEPENRAVRARLREIRALTLLRRPTVPSTIGQEKATNPFLRAGTPEMKAALGMEAASDLEVFAELRRRKDTA